MSVSYGDVKDFWDFVEYYPDEDEEGFDGIHYGGIKGIREDTPEAARQAYEEYARLQNQCEEKNIKL